VRPLYILSYYGALYADCGDENQNYADLKNYDCRLVLPNGNRWRVITTECNTSPWHSSANRNFPVQLYKVGTWIGPDIELPQPRIQSVSTLGQAVRYIFGLEGLEYSDKLEVVQPRYVPQWPNWWNYICRKSEAEYSFYHGVAQANWEREKAAHPEEWNRWRQRYGDNGNF